MGEWVDGRVGGWIDGEWMKRLVGVKMNGFLDNGSIDLWVFGWID